MDTIQQHRKAESTPVIYGKNSSIGEETFPSLKNWRMRPPYRGLFLCAKPDQALLRTTVLQLGSNPVQATSHAASIIGVLIDVKRFEQERPLVRAEMNDLSRN